MKLKLSRIATNGLATFGRIENEEHEQLCVTLEHPWQDNKRMISCIPTGDYWAFRRQSPKRGYELFELASVPGRSNIQIHIGNTVADTDGCILVGTNYGKIDGVSGVVSSRLAFGHLMKKLAGVDRFSLSIVDTLHGA